MTDGGSDHIEFLGSFEALDDPRQQAKVLYPLPEILLLCLCAVLGGADSWVEVALYGQRKLGFLRRFFPFAHGVPSAGEWTRSSFRVVSSPGWSGTAVRGVVAVDGKTLRRSFDRAAEQGPIHMISAWSSQQRLVLGQCKVADKSNEITAIPELLQLLELHGAVVTIDAMGCQRTIAAQIIDQKADYVFGLKGNRRCIRMWRCCSTNGRMVLRGTRSPCMRVLRRATGAWKRAVWLRPMILPEGPPMAGHAQRSEGREPA